MAFKVPLAVLVLVALNAAAWSAEPAADWNAKFEGKEGWIGGDGACSIVLDRERVLWLFADTILGSVKDGRRVNAVMVNNTLGVQSLGKSDAPIRFVRGKTDDGKPAAFFVPSDGKGYFWPQAGARAGARLTVLLAHIEKTSGKGAFAFRQIGEQLAVVENPDDEPEKWRIKQHQLPFVTFEPDHERSWGAAALQEGEHVYVYGFEQRGKRLGKRQLILARVPVKTVEDFSTWRFRTATGWSEKTDDSASLAPGLGTEFSVLARPEGGGYILVYTENGLSDRIVARLAAQPEGPWSEPILLYRCPEMAKDRGVFSYAARAHPWATNGKELLVSYCVNAWEFGRLFQDEAVYRPRFVRVPYPPAR